MSKIFSKALIIFSAFISVLHIAPAQASEWVATENIRARLVSTAPHDGVNAMLELRLSEGWHTYWHNPGDSGLPPRFDWSKSTNFDSAEILWPYPTRFDEYGMQTFGYKGDVSFPVKIVITDQEAPTTLHLKLDIMVCNEICIPDQLIIQTELNSKKPILNERMTEFKQRLIPHDGDTINLKIEGVVLGPNALVLNVFSKKGFGRADVFPIINDISLSAAPEIIPNKDDKRKAMVKITAPEDIDNLAKYMEGKELSIVFVAEKTAIHKTLSF